MLPRAVLVPSFTLPPAVVSPGRHLSALACRYQTTVAALEKFNDLGASSVLQIGQVLLIPPGAVSATPGTGRKRRMP